MIHTIYTCTIDRFTRVEAENNLSLLRRWYNPFPVKWFGKSVNRFLSDYRELINSDVLNRELSKEKSRLLTYNKLLLFDMLYEALCVAFKDRAVKDVLKSLSKASGIKYAIEVNDYVDEVKKYLNIEVKSVRDLSKVSKEIRRRWDKYRQVYFQESTNDSQKISFAAFTMGIFVFLDMTFEGSMSLYQFGQLKQVAEKKMHELEKQNKGN
jgi:hypothetical protein